MADKTIETTVSKITTTEKADKDIATKNDKDSLDSNFKTTMDNYEKFIDRYVEFMKNYTNSDNTNLSLLTDYADYMKKYAKVCGDFEKWNEKKLNTAETAYYIDV